MLPSSGCLGDRFWEHRLDIIKKKVALLVPAHFAGMDHLLEDMQLAVIRAGLPKQDKRRREEMRFIHNCGTLAQGGLKVSATLKIAIFPYLKFQRFQIDMLESFL